jgi:hypothetical protein
MQPIIGESMNKFKKTLSIVGLLTLVLNVTTQSVFAQTVNGTLSLNPGTSNIAPGSSQTIQVRVNTGTNLVRSMQIWIDVSGSIPSNLAVQAQTLSGLNLSSQTGVHVSGSNRIVLIAYEPTTSNPTYTTNGANSTIATITFTTPSSGSINFNFNSSQSGIYVDAADGINTVNVLSSTTNATYTVQATATPTPYPHPNTSTFPHPHQPDSSTRTPTPLPSDSSIPHRHFSPPTQVNLTVNFRLDGITSAVANQFVRVAVVANNQVIYSCHPQCHRQRHRPIHRRGQ